MCQLAIEKAATEVLATLATDEHDDLGDKLEVLRKTLAEAKAQGMTKSQMRATLEAARQAYPIVTESWPDILSQVEVAVWLENPFGERFYKISSIFDRLYWEQSKEDIANAALEVLLEDISAAWEATEFEVPVLGTPSNEPENGYCSDQIVSWG